MCGGEGLEMCVRVMHMSYIFVAVVVFVDAFVVYAVAFQSQK